jgi:ABC-type lipoprotein release transport system permease subunit
VRLLLEIAWTGLASVALHPLRSTVCILALLALLTPFLAGLAIARGVEAEAAEAVRLGGADLLVRGTQLGRPVPLPIQAAEDVKALQGVEEVVPRIVGEVRIGRGQVRCVLVGMPEGTFPAWVSCIEGKLPRRSGPHQLVLGSGLARRLGLGVGSRLPPFYRNDRLGERMSEVVGLFDPSAPMWQSHLVFTTFEDASAILGQQGLASGLLVRCAQGEIDEVAAEIERRLTYTVGAGEVRLEVATSEDLLEMLSRGPRSDQGVFNLHFVLAAVTAILVLLATSGMGLSERRREVGILKAMGWQTDQLLLRAFAESVALGVLGACLAFLLAWAWLRFLGGIGLVGVFLPGVDPEAGIRPPYRLMPVPLVLGVVLSLAVILTGSLYSTWRAAITPPREAMR